MRRRACPNDLGASGFHCTEIVPRSPFGFGAGEDRHIAAAVVIEILDAPLSIPVAVFVDRTSA
jgi:hypothetical protein